MRKYLFLSVMSMVLALPAVAQDPALQDPFKSSGKVISFNRLHTDGVTYGGIISLDGGQILVEGPNWDASLVHDGFATIDTWNFDSKDRYFFVDEKGKKAFGGQLFEGAGTFSEGKVFVAQKGRIKCMDTNGKILFTLPKDALYAMPFREGYAFYKGETGWWLVDEHGQDVFKECFADVQPFVSNGRIVVADGKTGLWGAMTVEGRQVLPFKYGYLGNINEAMLPEWVRVLGGPLLPFRTGDAKSKWGLLEVATGKEVVKPRYIGVLLDRGGFYFFGSEEENTWFDRKSRKWKDGPEDPEMPAALQDKYRQEWTHPITGTDLYMTAQKADMKFVIVHEDGRVAVPPTGYAYPAWADKEIMSTDYMARNMACARDGEAKDKLESRYMQADGDGNYETPDLTYFNPDAPDDCALFTDWIRDMAEEQEDPAKFSWDLKDIFLGTKPMKGILGNDRKEISVWFTDAEETEKGFAVKGKSSVAGGAACTFSGDLVISLLAVRTLESGKEMYLLHGQFYLEEDPGQKGSGYFDGCFLYYLEQTKGAKLVLVKDRNLPAELGYDMNKAFVGSWTSHRTGKGKRCNWADGFVPFSKPE